MKLIIDQADIEKAVRVFASDQGMPVTDETEITFTAGRGNMSATLDFDPEYPEDEPIEEGDPDGDEIVDGDGEPEPKAEKTEGEEITDKVETPKPAAKKAVAKKTAFTKKPAAVTTKSAGSGKGNPFMKK